MMNYDDKYICHSRHVPMKKKSDAQGIEIHSPLFLEELEINLQETLYHVMSPWLSFWQHYLSMSPASYLESNMETSTFKLLINKPPFLETSETDKSVHSRTVPKWDRLFKLLTRLQLAPATLIFTSPYNHNGISAIKMDLLISIRFSLSLLITVEHKLISA